MDLPEWVDESGGDLGESAEGRGLRHNGCSLNIIRTKRTRGKK